MAEETYNEFKVRVTDGQNLSEVDPVPLYESLKSERSEYVDRLKKEHRTAVLARHNRATKRPIITSEVTSGEVSTTDKEELIVEGDAIDSDPRTCSSSECQAISYQEKTKRMEIELGLRSTILLEHCFASIMGILAGIGAYVVTKEFSRLCWSLIAKFFDKAI